MHRPYFYTPIYAHRKFCGTLPLKWDSHYVYKAGNMHAKVNLKLRKFAFVGLNKYILFSRNTYNLCNFM